MLEQTLLREHKLHPKTGESFDIVVIGAGPAGMSAALCAARSSLKVLLIERALPGGQASTSYKITNYLGFPGGILGENLSFQMESQLEDYEIYFTREVVDDILNSAHDIKTIQTDMGNVYHTKAVIIAVGLEPKKLPEKQHAKFLGRGLSYYAQCDAHAYMDKDVAVIGGGNCACYAADHLSQFVNHLYLIHRSDSIKAVKTLKAKIMNNPKITIIWNSDMVDAFGIDKIEKIKIQNQVTQQHTWIDIKGLFVYVGRIPPKEILNLDLKTDENGYIITDEYMRTSIKGVYAAGDIREKQIRQIATAVSDGMIAAINAERDLKR